MEDKEFQKFIDRFTKEAKEKKKVIFDQMKSELRTASTRSEWGLLRFQDGRIEILEDIASIHEANKPIDFYE